jgi:hypothetical protein
VFFAKGLFLFYFKGMGVAHANVLIIHAFTCQAICEEIGIVKEKLLIIGGINTIIGA